MRAKRLVAMAALVALTFGSMAVAGGQQLVVRTAPRETRTVAGPELVKTGITDLAMDRNRQAPVMYGIREGEFMPRVPVQEPQVSLLCESGGLVQSLAGLLGFADLAVGCQERD